MIDPLNNSSTLTPAASQSANISEQEAQKQREVEQEDNQVQSSDQVSVSVSVDAVTAPEATANTSITSADEAAATASRVVNLFQDQPELAATAQGGSLTPEKADAYLKISVNVG